MTPQFSPSSISSHPGDFIPPLPKGSCVLSTPKKISWGDDAPQSCTPKPQDTAPTVPSLWHPQA